MATQRKAKKPPVKVAPLQQREEVSAVSIADVPLTASLIEAIAPAWVTPWETVQAFHPGQVAVMDELVRAALLWHLLVTDAQQNAWRYAGQ